MELSVMDVFSAVLTNSSVIIAAIAIILYLNFVIYVARYRKKPPKIKKKKKIVAEVPAPEPKTDEENQENEE